MGIPLLQDSTIVKAYSQIVSGWKQQGSDLYGRSDISLRDILLVPLGTGGYLDNTSSYP